MVYIIVNQKIENRVMSLESPVNNISLILESCDVVEVSSDAISCAVVEVDCILPVARSMNTGEVQPLHGLSIPVIYIDVSWQHLSSTENFYIGTEHCILSHVCSPQIQRTI